MALKIASKKRKSSFMLLEVLIAFTLITLSFLPLMTPHLQMIKVQNEGRIKMRTYLLSNYYYGKIIEKLYKNEISLQEILDKKTFVLEEEKERPFKGFKGEFKIESKRPKSDSNNYTLYRAKLTLTFTSTPDGKTYPFHYSFCLGSHLDKKTSENFEEGSNSQSGDDE